MSPPHRWFSSTQRPPGDGPHPSTIGDTAPQPAAAPAHGAAAAAIGPTARDPPAPKTTAATAAEAPPPPLPTGARWQRPPAAPARNTPPQLGLRPTRRLRPRQPPAAAPRRSLPTRAPPLSAARHRQGSCHTDASRSSKGTRRQWHHLRSGGPAPARRRRQQTRWRAGGRAPTRAVRVAPPPPLAALRGKSPSQRRRPRSTSRRGDGKSLFPVDAECAHRPAMPRDVYGTAAAEDGCPRDSNAARGCGCAAPPWHEMRGQIWRIKYEHEEIQRVANVPCLL